MEISRELYDHHDKESSKYKTEPGLNEETVTKISVYKHEPDWMLKKRLTALKIFNELKLPTWGPNLEKLDLNKITYFNIPDAKQNADSWDKVPEEIKKTFERLGIP
jgi:Fe-S cluster assembly protein SufB